MTAMAESMVMESDLVAIVEDEVLETLPDEAAAAVDGISRGPFLLLLRFLSLLLRLEEP